MGLFDFLKNKKNKEVELGEVQTSASTSIIESLLEKAAVEPGLRPEFYKQLLESELIILTNESTRGSGIHTLEENTKVQIVTLSDGRIPVFTSTERILDNGIVKTQVPFLGMNGRSLFEMTKGATLVLNPFSDSIKELTISEISSLLDGSIFQPQRVEEVKKETKIRIGQPANIPDGLKKSLIEYAKSRNEVEAVYIAMIERVDLREYPSLMVGLRVAKNEQEVFGELGQVIRPHLSEGKHVEMMQIKGNEGLSGYFNQVAPIYQKA